MKLHEIKQTRVAEAKLQSIELKAVDLWDEAGLEPVDVEVEFDYEPPIAQRHPYGEGSATEYLGAVVDIASVRLTKEANVYKADDETVVRVLAKGTDLVKEPFFKKRHLDILSDMVAGKMES